MWETLCPRASPGYDTPTNPCVWTLSGFPVLKKEFKKHTGIPNLHLSEPYSMGNMKIRIKRRLFPKCLEVVLFIKVLDLLSKPKRQKPDIYFYQLILHRTLLIFPHCFWCKSFIKFCITNGLAPSLDGNSDFLRWYKEEGWLVDYSLSFIVYLHWVVYLLG